MPDIRLQLMHMLVGERKPHAILANSLIMFASISVVKLWNSSM